MCRESLSIWMERLGEKIGTRPPTDEVDSSAPTEQPTPPVEDEREEEKVTVTV